MNPIHKLNSLFNKLFRINKPIYSAASVFMAMLTTEFVQSQPAENSSKFLGNITSRGQVRSDYMDYWNQITGENEHKWGSVERSRDQMSWRGGDAIRDFAEAEGIPWKFHTLIWGSQYPNWMTSLSQQEQLEEIEEWFDLAKERYDHIPMIDVVNEAHPNHAVPPFDDALGGNGSSGHDWIIKAFEMARERWPDAILIYNDFNIIEWNNELNWVIDMVKTLINEGAPIDAIGAQAHDAHRVNTSTLKSNIDRITSETGLPMFITEFDIPDGNDESQRSKMEDKMTMFWNHPKIAGITIWGYVMGQTWVSNSGLIQDNGTPRPAMTWLMDYVADNPEPPNDYPDLLGDGPISTMRKQKINIDALMNNENGLKIFDLQGREIASFNAGNSGIKETINQVLKAGNYIVKSGNISQAINVTH